jgi:hypothetical protein
MGEIEFEFQEKGAPVSYCIRMASKMQQFDNPENQADLIRHMYVVDQLDKPRVQ